jgi:bidirectional [NiFe] hydrogenase diaphorase subunit
MDHVRYEYLHPELSLDASHDRFVLDHNRCILCSRCVRVCDEIEGAHVWDVMGRGANSRVIIDLNQPWGSSQSCTACGKCVQVCPTGALFTKGSTVAEMEKQHNFLRWILDGREKKVWSYEKNGK